jgi:hypothetical protein
MRALHKAAADKTDVLAKHVELVAKGGRYFHFVDLLVDLIEPREQCFPLL